MEENKPLAPIVWVRQHGYIVGPIPTTDEEKKQIVRCIREAYTKANCKPIEEYFDFHYLDHVFPDWETVDWDIIASSPSSSSCLSASSTQNCTSTTLSALSSHTTDTPSSSVITIPTSRLLIFSDLHLDHYDFEWSYDEYLKSLKDDEAHLPTICVLAGDISNSFEQSKNWILQFLAETKSTIPIVLVLGNHEFYNINDEDDITRPVLLEKWKLFGRNTSASSSTTTTNNKTPYPLLTVLDNDDVEINGIRFVGSTLWTNVNNMDFATTLAIESQINDFAYIRETPTSCFQVADFYCLHKYSVKWLLDWAKKQKSQVVTEQKKEDKKSPKVVVITHHLPTFQSIAPKYKGSVLNHAFASDLPSLLSEMNAAVWIHGHTHTSLDYRDSRVPQTRIICNPRGYGSENLDFNPYFSITL